nr:hypothetical protein [Sedimentibacter sp.]
MFKKFIIVGLAVVVLAATSLTAFAVTGNSTPAEILTNITGRSTEEVTAQKLELGKTYGEIANDEGLWEEFNDKMLENKKTFLDEKVAEGTLSQEKADEIYESILERQQYFNSNGNGGMMGYGFGNGSRSCLRGWQ